MPSPQTTCPRCGNVNDPNWDKCPFCRSDEQRNKPSQAPASVAPAGRRTVIEGIGEGAGAPPARTGDRRTSVMPAGGPSADHTIDPGGSVGRIVGVIATFTWRPSGELFLVRQGRNFIGADGADITITSDARMSSEHALLLCRHGTVELYDQKSINGTFVNGEMVPPEGVRLEDDAVIKTGGTTWRFLEVVPPDAPAAPPTDRPEPPTRGDTHVD